MFKIEPNPTFTVAVNGFVPGGSPRDGLMVEYRYKTPEEFTAWIEEFKDRKLTDVLMDVIAGWKDAPFEFSAESIDKIAKLYPAFPLALMDSYRAELFEAKRKN